MNIDQLRNYLTSDPYQAMSDDHAATALSTPVLTPKPIRITYTTAGASLGGIKAATLRGTLLSPQVQATPLGPVASYVDTLLGGPGFDATNADVQALAAQFVASGILSQSDANTLLCDASYLCGGVVTTADVTAARAETVRRTAIDVIRQKITGVYSTFANDVMNVAESDATKPIPTYDDFLAAVQAGGK